MAGSPSAVHGSAPSGSSPAPDADEPVGLPLPRDGRRLGVARIDDRVGRQLHQRAHDRVAQVGVGRVARRFDAADGVLEQGVAGEHDRLAAAEAAGRGAGGGTPGGAWLGAPPERSPTRNESIPAVCPGVCSGHTSSVPNRSVWPASTVPIARRRRPRRLVARRPPHQVALDRADQDLELRPALAQLVDLAHVVEVVMGEQHVRRRQPQALGGVDQRLDGTAGVDEERRAALAVGDEVGVRQELGIAGRLDDHCGNPCTMAVTPAERDRSGPAGSARRRRRAATAARRPSSRAERSARAPRPGPAPS